MKKRTILVVDDEYDIRNMLKNYLEMNNYDVLTAKNSKEAFEIILSGKIDLVLLDIMMPGMDGIEFCKMVREKINCPIIFLSAKNLEEDIIKALSIGGDDYITKPFSLKELLARIESHIRREERIRTTENLTIRSGNIVLDVLSKEVFCKGNRLDLTRKEYEVLEFLMMNKNIVFSRERIFDNVWGFDSNSNLEAVTEVIKNIRKKIKEYDHQYSYIQTVYGLGYKWEVRNED
ncbi:DNA-binding response regulator, OmpR family, contains REC and winged-helix (wHTH) domain [Fervidobacterium changbaicum]|uniref:DNA-binding response regulator n=1 Tax=Fervidobacterium changbaicum TaxID=310769 RepID=A0ABX5QTB1_9BACT|nr:response regulator transcription factor [Fervidobacterium changbaicum]QAV33345.1 DNA-binding response regulator [Fervidobacterium changbaicum]SDG89241.1 DNA-binding response regulator, OmpR family, contains REC and winged-helix (wHTH) domain [Fervidobacterium changbaicum]